MLIRLSTRLAVNLSNSNIQKAAIISGLLLLSACSSMPQTAEIMKSPPNSISATKILSDVPFYPQTEFFCGPTTLSEVFAYHGKNIDAQAIAPKVFIPEKNGSLQIEMKSVSRQYGFLPYSDNGDLLTLLTLVDNDTPVIVFQNNGLSWAPLWHYAVVIGYDLSTFELILHTGVTPNHKISFDVFERTWKRGEYWYLAPLPIGFTAEFLDEHIYIQAAFDQLQIGQVHTALANLRAANKQWPDNWLPYFLIGNHFLEKGMEKSGIKDGKERELESKRESDLAKALAWFTNGYSAGAKQAAYLNNFSYALWTAGCQQQSEQVLAAGLQQFPNNGDLKMTEQDIKQKSPLRKLICPTIPQA